MSKQKMEKCGTTKGSGKERVDSRKSKSGKTRREFRPNGTRPERKDEGYAKDALNKHSHDINDSSYYIDDPAVVGQTFDFSFRDFMGMPVDLQDGQLGVPGIMGIYVNPCIPFTNPQTAGRSGFETAMYKITLKQTMDNKRPVEYGSEDVGIPVLAMGSILSLVGDIRRSFAYAAVFNARNRLWPKGVLAALGVTDEDTANLANLRNHFNVDFLPVFNSIPMYGNMPYFTKCSNMFQNVYLDQDGSGMAQAYFLAPETLWEFDDTYSEQGAGLKTVVVKGKSLSEKIDLAIEMADRLLSSKHLLTIQGDLMRYAANHNIALLSTAPILESEVAVPGNSSEIDYWLDNATVMVRRTVAGSVPEGYTPDNDVTVDQSKHICVYRPYYTFMSPVDYLSHNKVLINFWHADPTLDEKIYATRLCTPGKWVASGPSLVATDIACCDWMINSIAIFAPYDGFQWRGAAEHASDYSKSLMYDAYRTANINANTDIAKEMLQLLEMLTQFDHHPRITLVDVELTAGAHPEYVSVNGDLQYFTGIDFNDMKAIHDVCALGLWRI